MKLKNREVILILCSLVMFYLSNGLNCIPILTWVYPILLLFLIKPKKPFKGSLILFLILFIGFIMQWIKVLGIDIGILIALAATISLMKCLPYILYSKIQRHQTKFIYTLVFPVLLVSVEYIIYLIYPILAGLSEAYTQYENLVLINITSLLGIYSITFVMGWTASVVNWIIANKSIWSKIKKGVSIYCSIMLCVFIYGITIVYLLPNDSELIRVASITVPVKKLLEGDKDVSKVFYSKEFDEQQLVNTKSKLEEIHNQLLDKTAKEADAGAKIIYWSELNGAVMNDDEAQLIERASNLAKQKDVYLIISLLVKTPYKSLKENKTVAINREGKIVAEYFKSGVSIGELCIKGDGKIQTFDTEYGRIATYICSDLAFMDMIRQVGKNQVDLLIVPSSDWKYMSQIATKTAIVRAVENGCSLSRQTNMGISITSDNKGKVLSTNNYFLSKDRSMVAFIPINHRLTLYPHVANIFEFTCIGITLIMFVYIIINKLRSK